MTARVWRPEVADLAPCEQSQRAQRPLPVYRAVHTFDDAGNSLGVDYEPVHDDERARHLAYNDQVAASVRDSTALARRPLRCALACLEETLRMRRDST